MRSTAPNASSAAEQEGVPRLPTAQIASSSSTHLGSDQAGDDSSQGDSSSLDQFTDALSDLGDASSSIGPAGRPASNIETARDPQTPARYLTPSPSSPVGEDLTTPTRQRLSNAPSMGFISPGPSQGRRAAAPTALDLSPRANRTMSGDDTGRRDSRYGGVGIGLGQAPLVMDGVGRRVATDSQASSSASRRVSRPLPQVPQQPARSTSMMYPGAYASPLSSFASPGQVPFRQAGPFMEASSSRSPAQPVLTINPSQSLPVGVPLSAVGSGPGQDAYQRRSSVAAASSLNAGGLSLSQPIDAYFGYATSPMPQQPFLAPNAFQDGDLSPSSPGRIDPETLDRRGLIGTGELATPRWASSSLRGHSRTPSLPSSLPQGFTAPSASLISSSPSDSNWAKQNSGLGLAVGMMDRVQEETPQPAGGRNRPLSHIEAPPRPARRASRDLNAFGPVGTSRPALSSQPSASSAAGLGSYADAMFDNDIGAALAATLRLNDDPSARLSPPPTLPPVQTSPMRQAQQSYFTALEGSSPSPGSTPAGGASIGSPGSARQRIFARRQERQAAAISQQNQDPLMQSLPPRSSSHASTPPAGPSGAQTAAAAARAMRDPRKTPPARHSDNAAGGRGRPSPSSTHHEIMRHLVPRDFSHLPPSPSSASITQFLKASGSINDLSGTSSPGSTVPQQHAVPFPLPPSGSRQNLLRSDSQRTRHGSAAPKEKDMDPETAEALRKLDGLGSTPVKSRNAKTKSSAGPASGRPSTPPGVKKHKSLAGIDAERPSMSDDRRKSSGSTKSLGASGPDSPLQNWVDILPEVPGLPPPPSQGNAQLNGKQTRARPVEPLAMDKPASSSSTSHIGTPTSRDSVPTSATTPSSWPGRQPDGGPRRASAGSEASSSDGAHHLNGSYEKVGEVSVPPVPPLPRGFASMAQGLSSAAGGVAPTAYVPLREAASDEQVGEFGAQRPPLAPSGPSNESMRMKKKWSFSSALNLKLGGKDKDLVPAPPATAPLPSSDKEALAHQWSEVNRSELLLPPDVQRKESSESSSQASRSNHTVTPVSTSLAPTRSVREPPRKTSSSSIPFFRRASSSSVTNKVPTPPSAPASIPETPDDSPQQSPSNAPVPLPGRPANGTRKSVLGMHLPSMLRGSGSKRGLAQQLTSPELPQGGPTQADLPADLPRPTAATTGWKGRARGKTLSISGPIQVGKMSAPPEGNPQMVHQLLSKPSIESIGQPRASVSSNRSEATVQGNQSSRIARSGLTPITASPAPAVRNMASISSLRERAQPSATPTKIPRIAGGRPSPGPGSMLPPAFPSAHTAGPSRHAHAQSMHARTMTHASSIPDLARIGVSEFGSLPPSSSTRHVSHSHTASEAHRSRLLAPMSSRPETKRNFAKPIDHSSSRRELAANIPPSKRHLPMPPPSTATAMTISAAAKRTSKEIARPANIGRRDSKDTPSDGGSETTTPSGMKPSKSLHSKLNAPNLTARIPASSSMGAPGSGHRQTSLLPDSASSSPADDDEALADAEMLAYVNRRKARAAMGKRDDLKDVEDFPEDIAPAAPMSQRTYIGKHLANMSDFERKEILDWQDIYFIPDRRISRPRQPNGQVYNYGYDDERGDYVVVQGDHLCYRYEVVGVLGKGSFGQVLQCRDHMTGKSVAVKIIRNKKRFYNQALVEIKILEQLREWDPEDKHRMIRITDSFYFRSHLCIVTELLSINLYELIKANQFAGFSTTLIRRFTVQMLSSLQLMRSKRIVHCDLKPENILLCHPCKSGIKVIDFGSSCLETEKVYTYIQSRFYRSPEVILGMNYAMAIDMWSVGCILAELYTGVPIFPGENEQEQLACIMEVLGVPDRYLVNQASRRKVFFDSTGAPRPFVNGKGKRRRPGSRTLAQAMRCNDELFVDFIAKCLIWDPDRRLKPQQAMRHPWIIAGRRRSPAPPAASYDSGAPTPRTSFFSSGSNGAARAMVAGDVESPSSAARHKTASKDLVISPPTPLMARQGQGQAHSPMAAPRMGRSDTSQRLGQVTARSSAFMAQQTSGGL